MAGGLKRLNQRVIVIAIRRAEKDRLGAGDLFNFFIAGCDLLQHLLAGKRGHVRVGIGMIHHFIARVRQRLHRLGIFVHPLSHYKECRMHMMLTENIDQLLRVFIPPCRVKTDAHHFVRPIHTVNRQFSLCRHRRHHMRNQISHGGNQSDRQSTDRHAVNQ